MQLELHLPVQMHIKSRYQAQNENFLVKNGKFVLVALTLPTVQHVEIFPGAEKDPGRELLGRRPRARQFPGCSARGHPWKR